MPELLGVVLIHDVRRPQHLVAAQRAGHRPTALHDDERACVAAGELQEFPVIDVRQVAVHKDQVERLGLEEGQGFAAAPGRARVESFAARQAFQGIENGFVVLDDEDMVVTAVACGMRHAIQIAHKRIDGSDCPHRTV